MNSANKLESAFSLLYWTAKHFHRTAVRRRCCLIFDTWTEEQSLRIFRDSPRGFAKFYHNFSRYFSASLLAPPHGSEQLRKLMVNNALSLTDGNCWRRAIHIRLTLPPSSTWRAQQRFLPCNENGIRRYGTRRLLHTDDGNTRLISTLFLGGTIPNLILPKPFPLIGPRPAVFLHRSPFYPTSTPPKQ